LSVLKENLLAQGVSVDNVSVRHENTESEYESDYTEQEENSKGGYKHQEAKKQKENGKNFEEMMFNLENEENV
jgi:flagellar hook-length control protein FliK